MDNPDGSKRTKLRPIALLETHLKLIESVAVDQHADHIIALMQEQQVGFRVRGGAEAMINAVIKFLKNDTNRILMQGDIANAYGSINRLSVLEAVRKHIPCLAPLCASQFVRDGTVAVIQERREWEEARATLQCSEGCLAREHAEQRDILPDLLEQDVRSVGTGKQRGTCDGHNRVRRRLHSEL